MLPLLFNSIRIYILNFSSILLCRYGSRIHWQRENGERCAWHRHAKSSATSDTSSRTRPAQRWTIGGNLTSFSRLIRLIFRTPDSVSHSKKETSHDDASNSNSNLAVYPRPNLWYTFKYSQHDLLMLKHLLIDPSCSREFLNFFDRPPVVKI